MCKREDPNGLGRFLSILVAIAFVIVFFIVLEAASTHITEFQLGLPGEPTKQSDGKVHGSGMDP